MIPIKTQHSRMLLYVVLPLILVAGALLYTIRVCAAGQEARPENRITEQSVAEGRERGAKAIKYATDFQWVASPSEDLSAAGAKTIHLARCAPGVFGNAWEYWVYIAGAGRPEAVKVTGGSCKGDDQPGTLQFTTSVAHGAGYTLSSASSGLQEASMAAGWRNSAAPNYTSGGKVIAPPGEFRIYAPVSFLTTAQTIDFSGSMFECWVADDACLKVGRSTDYNGTLSVTLLNPRGRPTQLHGQQTMIAVYGQKTRIVNLMTMTGVALQGKQLATFGSYIKVIGDQAFLLDGLDTSPGYGLECTPAFCGTVIVAPGPFGNPYNAAVGWLKNLNLNLQCMGNGIDWQSGNTLRVSDSVIQGYSQFGVRGGTARGGYGMIEMDNIYMEDAATCPNPLGNVGAVGVLVQGGKVDIRGGEGPSGHFPAFAKTGKIQYDYYLVAHNPRYGASNPLYAGYALTNGSGAIRVTTPDIPGAATLDLLRVTTPTTGNAVWNSQAPNGTGNFAVVTGVTRAMACANGACTFTDSNAAPTSYTVPAPNYSPFVSYWPGSISLFPNGDGGAGLGAVAVVALNMGWAGPQANVNGWGKPSLYSEQCNALTGSPIWQVCTGADTPSPHTGLQSATIMPAQGDANFTNLKGRLNLGVRSGAGPNHIITLLDSNWIKTLSTLRNRPSNDPGDAYIGQDTSSGNFGLSLGAPGSISQYIGNAGDGKDWKERLTGKEKTFAVPVVVEDGSTLKIGNGTAISQMKIFHTAAIPPSRVPGQSCVDVKGTAEGLTASDQVTGITPPKPLGNLALNAYASGTNSVTLHFCNSGAAAASVPAGAYTFLGVR